MVKHSDEFGWVLAPNASVRDREPDFSVTYHTDREGLRVTAFEEWTSPIVSVYGDSFTDGIGVEDDQTFASVLSRVLPEAHVRNCGVRGYSPDQYYLRFKKDLESTSQAPTMAIFGVYPSNDLDDINRRYVQAYIGTSSQAGRKTKPWLARVGNSFEFQFPNTEMVGDTESNSRSGLRNGLATLLRRSEFLRFLYDIRARLPGLHRFADGVRDGLARVEDADLQAGAERFRWCVEQIARTRVRSLYLLIPSKNLYSSGGLTGEDKAQYQAAKTVLHQSAVPYLDLLALMPSGQDYYFAHDGHLNKAGHEFLGTSVYRRLGELGWLTSAGHIALAGE